jgi:hypothetical protein
MLKCQDARFILLCKYLASTQSHVVRAARTLLGISWRGGVLRMTAPAADGPERQQIIAHRDDNSSLPSFFKVVLKNSEVLVEIGVIFYTDVVACSTNSV